MSSRLRQNGVIMTIIDGDFKTALEVSDHKGGGVFNTEVPDLLHELCYKQELTNIWRLLPAEINQFTWSRKNNLHSYALIFTWFQIS